MSENKNELFSDLLIKKVVQEDMKRAPEMPFSEDETWRMIQKKMRKRKFKKGSRAYKFSIIAASIILIFVFSFVQVQSGNAFGWLTKYVFKTQGQITNIESTNITSTEKGIPSPDEVKNLSILKRTEHMNLSDAQNVTSFKIVIPKYIPEGFTLHDVLVEFEGENNNSNRVTLLYKKGEELFSIKQLYIDNQYGNTFGVDNEDTTVKEVEIFNQKATFIIFKDNSKILFWDNMQLHFRIESSLTENEILKIAQSM